MMIMQR